MQYWGINRMEDDVSDDSDDESPGIPQHFMRKMQVQLQYFNKETPEIQFISRLIENKMKKIELEKRKKNKRFGKIRLYLDNRYERNCT